MPSSVIAWMDYDPSACALRIDYRGARGLYRYFDVPAEVWLAFRSAESKGTYLNEIFKPKKYRYERVTGPRAPIRTGKDESWGVAYLVQEPDAATARSQKIVAELVQPCNGPAV